MGHCSTGGWGADRNLAGAWGAGIRVERFCWHSEMRVSDDMGDL